MDETNPERGSSETNQPLRVVIAYNDLTAGRRAMRLLSNVGKELGGEIEFQPIPWSFDLLEDMDWRDVAASDAVNADILIIATSDADPLPPAVGRWTDTAFRDNRRSAAVVALFGSEENSDRYGSSRLHAIQTAAHREGLDFFAPTPRQKLEEAITRIHERAETITPVLEGILHLPRSASGQIDSKPNRHEHSSH